MAKGKQRKMRRPDGEVRHSQLITTYGPGSMVDLVDSAVLIAGLDHWRWPKKTGWTDIVEPRLREALTNRFHEAGLEISLEGAFREPPAGDDRGPDEFNGISALIFPQWFVCQNPKCRALTRYDGLTPKSGRYYHDCSGRKASSECVPVRFVSACRRGHLQDFPWIPFVHEGAEQPCTSKSLTLKEGSSGDFSEIWVQCSCGASRRLADAIGKAEAKEQEKTADLIPKEDGEETKKPKGDKPPSCQGRRPWLGREGDESCGEISRLLVRTASNSYFSQVVSALSIPEKGRELDVLVEQHMAMFDIDDIDLDDMAYLRKKQKKFKKAFSEYTNEEVLESVSVLKSGVERRADSLRTAEFKQLVSQEEEVPGVLPPKDEHFYARTFTSKEGLPPKVGKIVLAHKLREVRVQIGFTRIEPVSPDLEGEFNMEVVPAALGLNTNWLPASEINGEGIFLQLDDEAVIEWEAREAVKARRAELRAGFKSMAESDSAEFPGVRFYMLHSLSHLLISALSLECGYAASAIRERIYCSLPGTKDTPMAGILLSTGTAGSEGTLGGLVDQGRELRSHLRRAYDLGRLCSNDPVCSTHSPKGDHAERYLEGAACHGCLYVAECSCERFNRYLDRALVVSAIGHDPALAFFSERP